MRLKKEILDTFCLSDTQLKECSLWPLLFNIVLEVLASAIRQEKWTLEAMIEREERSYIIGRWYNYPHRATNRIISQFIRTNVTSATLIGVRSIYKNKISRITLFLQKLILYIYFILELYKNKQVFIKIETRTRINF